MRTLFRYSSLCLCLVVGLNCQHVKNHRPSLTIEQFTNICHKDTCYMLYKHLPKWWFVYMGKSWKITSHHLENKPRVSGARFPYCAVLQQPLRSRAPQKPKKTQRFLVAGFVPSFGVSIYEICGKKNRTYDNICQTVGGSQVGLYFLCLSAFFHPQSETVLCAVVDVVAFLNLRPLDSEPKSEAPLRYPNWPLAAATISLGKRLNFLRAHFFQTKRVFLV